MTNGDTLQAASRWYFYKNPAGLWCWDATDRDGNIVLRSACTFDSRTACVEHARRHGYGPGEMIDAAAS